MVRLLAVLVVAVASVEAQTVTQAFGSGAYSFSMEFVTIGNPNNSADTRLPSTGSVPYVYNLGIYEVSRDMVLKASTAGGLGMTLQDMTSYGGNGLNRPATGINWNEAARFVNWLNTSKGYQAAYNFDVSGNFQLWGGGQYVGSNQYRHKDAYYFLPNRDEWYKGAFYDPNKMGGPGYWDYPNGSNSAPSSASGGTSAGTAVYWRSSPADINDAGGLGPYGTMAQAGNVEEWLETAADLENNSTTENREARGGSFNYGPSVFIATSRSVYSPTAEYNDLGFRVAMIPEPSSLSLLLAGGAVLMAGRRRIRGLKDPLI